MRKRIIEHRPQDLRAEGGDWLNFEHLTQVEITSEAVGYPIESVLIPGMGPGWRAAKPGEQIIRFLFGEPQKIKRIRLAFQEDGNERTQEFVLRWSQDGGQSHRQIVRQQCNFSSPDAANEVEDYGVNLEEVTVLELRIVPDISGGNAPASLAQLRLS